MALIYEREKDEKLRRILASIKNIMTLLTLGFSHWDINELEIVSSQMMPVVDTLLGILDNPISAENL
ncbi:MAG: hypothetical protein ACYTXC_21400 [Nostoc sp.]